MPWRPGKRDSRSPWTSHPAIRATARTRAPPSCSGGGRSTSLSSSARPQVSPRPWRPREAPKLDARGMVVMPGGVDIHSHIAGSSVNHGRRLLPEEHAADPAPAPRLADPDATPRSGTGGTIPSSFTTGYRYAGLGYTTAMEAAVAPLAAPPSHREPDAPPIPHF